jgi:hypothetical protein
VLLNLERPDGIVALRLRFREPKRSVQGTELHGIALSASYTVLRAGNRLVGPLWQTAVATPVSNGLCPSQTSLHSSRRVRGHHRRTFDEFAQNRALRALCAPHELSSVARATAEGGIEWLR